MGTPLLFFERTHCVCVFMDAVSKMQPNHRNCRWLGAGLATHGRKSYAVCRDADVVAMPVCIDFVIDKI